jgi:predicted HAD superfamily phosphohydrolase
VALAKRPEEKNPHFWEKIAPWIVITPSEKEKGMALGEIIGTRFFHFISVIDDIWGDFHRIPKDPSYSSGHTLKDILPFFKAMGATHQWLYDFAKRSVRAVPNIQRVLPRLDRKYNVWMVSTSYEFFIQAFCNLVGFDFNRVCCTLVPEFDEIPISPDERMMLLRFMKSVAEMPLIEYNKETGKVISEHQTNYDVVTDFIWNTVYRMPVGELLRIVHPVGQAQKREEVEKILREYQVPLKKVMGVGDSQTDFQWVQFLKGIGLSMMFNGKGNVCYESDIMYIGEDAGATEEVANLFAKVGRQGVINYYTPPRQAQYGGLLAAVTPENIEELEPLSVKKRKEFRGVAIGELA